MSDEQPESESEDWVPSGAAIMPEIPPELGVHPLLLAVLHALVFLEGSDDDIVDADAAAESIEYMAAYLQRLSGPDLLKVREDVAALAGYARHQEWPRASMLFFKEFISNFGIDGTGDAEQDEDEDE